MKAFSAGKAALNFILILATVLAAAPSTASAGQGPAIASPSAMLIEESTGKVLYAVNENEKMYPASMTKLITGIVALDYLDPDEIVLVGNEVYRVPDDSSKAGHKAGESITVENLLRGLFMQSGNESGVILAVNAVRKMRGDYNISYSESEKIFCDLMNEKAVEVGAVSSHFVNPHGYHDPYHYTTASDMLKIAADFMKHPILRQIVAEKSYRGNSLGGMDSVPGGLMTQEYSWESHNDLLLDGENHYDLATGIKTGYTSQAGYCLVSSAVKNGMTLFAVVFNDPEPERWKDTVAMFEYGFANFRFETVLAKGEPIDRLAVSDPRLGGETEMDIYAAEGFAGLYSDEERGRVTREVAYDRGVLSAEGELKTPVARGEVLGSVSLALDGEVIFTADAVAGAEALERTNQTDKEYKSEQFRSFVFSAGAVPYWIGAAVLFVALVVAAVFLIRSRMNRNKSYYKLNKRYF